MAHDRRIFLKMEEKFVELNYNGCNLYGIQHIPDCISPKSSVIFVHGIPGDRVDAKRINVRIARQLQKNGHQSFRFDFLASGISEGSYENVTFKTFIEQLELIVSYVNQLGGKDIYLLASSDAARIVLQLAQRCKIIKGLILINGIITPEAVTIKGFNRLYRIGKQLACDIGYGVWINSEILKEGFQFSIDKIRECDCLFIYGTGDVLTKHSLEKIEAQNFNCYKITDADHLFTRRSWELELINAISAFMNGEKL